MQPTIEEIQRSQGTRLSSKPQWETYGSEMESKMSPELQEQVKRYEERRHVKASQQAQEELAEQRELSDAVAGNYQWVKPEEYKDIAPKIGHIMHSTVFINKLRNECKLRCWYIPHPLPRRLTLMVQRDYQDPEFACWVQEGHCPEFSVMKFDEHGVPLDERLRGWRTPLLQMILKGFISEEKAKKVFGVPEGPASVRYNSMLYEVRNKRVKAKEE